jgi:hypothetical protein
VLDLAERLGKYEWQVRSEMSGAELHRWMMRDRLRAAEAKEREREMKRKQKRGK